jgi:hypothetical protein
MVKDAATGGSGSEKILRLILSSARPHKKEENLWENIYCFGKLTRQKNLWTLKSVGVNLVR